METKFRESIDKAVHNPNLTGALGRFSEAYRISRQKAYEGYDFEALRERKLPNENPTRPLTSMNSQTYSRRTSKPAGPRYFVPTIPPGCASIS
jgi:hypothetical protein